MKQLSVQACLMFDTDQITQGPNKRQIEEAVDIINATLQREPYGLGAQIIVDKVPVIVEERQI